LASHPNVQISTFHQGLTDTRGNWTGAIKLNEEHLHDPVGWRDHERIAVAYHGDLFLASDDVIGSVVQVIDVCPQHTFLMLTKRVEQMRTVFSCGREFNDPWPSNLWLGLSITRQCDADRWLKPARALAAAGWNIWCSYEPALEGIDWSGWEFLRFFVAGGESGPEARPAYPDWFRAARDWCLRAKVPFWFKQWGEYCDWDQLPEETVQELDAAGEAPHERPFYVGKKAAGRRLDGREWNELPEVWR
jgi:protein gp37